jgi:hypothetical protein
MTNTYKITGYIQAENGQRQVVNDILNANETQVDRNTLADEYIVRWAMVKGQVIADFSLAIERL